MSFPRIELQYIFASKTPYYARYTNINIRPHHPWRQCLRSLHLKTSEVFKEEHNIAPIIINDKMKYIPWGGDNQMPYNIIDLIESDETMSTCQMFNAETS